ncbi:hypothetical protein SPJ2_0189 [Streptococcus parauberis KRS-02109]|nr:hypothetical protein SPJ2_0189 [Streptococcus parauberis KRS-02109]
MISDVAIRFLFYHYHLYNYSLSKAITKEYGQIYLIVPFKKIKEQLK